MHGHVIETVFTVPRVIVHAQDVKQRRLPRSGRTHDRNELSGLDVQIDASQHIVLRHALRETFFDVAQTNHLTLAVARASCAWLTGGTPVPPVQLNRYLTSTNPLSLSSCLASSIWRRLAPVSSSTIRPSNRCTMRSACRSEEHTSE